MNTASKFIFGLVLVCFTAGLNGQTIPIGQTIYGLNNNENMGSDSAVNADGSVIAISNGSVADVVKVVRVYQFQNGGWVQMGQDLVSADGVNLFGRELALNASGEVLAIGSLNSADFNGSAQVFAFDGTEWVQRGDTFVGNSGQRLGSGIDLSDDGSRLVIGAANSDNTGPNNGEIRVYDYDGSQWNQVGPSIFGSRDFDFLGTTVRISGDGNRIAGGAPNAGGGESPAGHIRVYDFDDTQWNQLGGDIAGVVGQGLGIGLDMTGDGSTVIASTPYSAEYGTNSGIVRAYTYDGNQWVQLGQDLYDVPSSYFGWEIAIDDTGTKLICGSHWYQNFRGQVAIFQFVNDNWERVIDDLIGEELENLGTTVNMASDGQTLIIGSAYEEGQGLTENGKVEIAGVKYLGIEENIWNSSLLNLYPNPVDERLFLVLTKALQVQTVSVFNTIGQRVVHRSIQEQASMIELDLGDLPGGVYILELDAVGGDFRETIIKQ